MAALRCCFSTNPDKGRQHSARRPRATRCAAQADDNSLSLGDSRAALQAFFYGRAAGQVLLERVSELALDAAAEVSRAQAERSKIWAQLPRAPLETAQKLVDDLAARQPPSPDVLLKRFDGIDQEVEQRARTAIAEELGIEDTTLSDEDRENQLPELPDTQETMDDLRADIAAARASLRRYIEQSKDAKV